MIIHRKAAAYYLLPAWFSLQRADRVDSDGASSTAKAFLPALFETAAAHWCRTRESSSE